MKIHHLILFDLGEGKINAEQAGDAYDLMGGIATDGTTHDIKLARNEYYKKAVAGWVAVKQAQRQRFTESKSM
ncbi:MAG: hypothetical protein KAV87_54200 [Desulfobacteraceae bacterium]|nr:hypothetical protein [Desulfobacteraceae bacterium]